MLTNKKFQSQIFFVALIVFSVFMLSITSTGEETNSGAESLKIVLIELGEDQITVIANQSSDEITLEGYRLIAQGSDFQFEFSKVVDPVMIQPFGVLRIHSGSDAKTCYENSLDIFWTNQDIWGESKVAKLVYPDGEVASTYNYSEKTDLDRFAGCLTKQGVKLKTLPYCGACMDQKELLGESTRYLINVNCSKFADFCGKRHKYVPAWVSREKVLEGDIYSPEELAEAFNCELEVE